MEDISDVCIVYQCLSNNWRLISILYRLDWLPLAFLPNDYASGVIFPRYLNSFSSYFPQAYRVQTSICFCWLIENSYANLWNHMRRIPHCKYYNKDRLLLSIKMIHILIDRHDEITVMHEVLTKEEEITHIHITPMSAVYDHFSQYARSSQSTQARPVDTGSCVCKSYECMLSSHEESFLWPNVHVQ